MRIRNAAERSRGQRLEALLDPTLRSPRRPLARMLVRQPWRLAATLAGAYLLFTVLWIIVSDAVAGALIEDPVTLTAVQVVKGVVYAVVGAALLYVIFQRAVSATLAGTRRTIDLIDGAQNAMLFVDTEGRYRFWNPALRDLTGFSDDELAEMRVPDLSAPPLRDITVRQLDGVASGGTGKTTYRSELRHRDDFSIPALVCVTAIRGRRDEVVGTLSEFVDLRGEISLREQLLSAQRTEALGTLVAGVAHDFNNLLTAMLGSIELAKMQPERAEEWLDRAGTAGDRAAELTRRLLNYSRKQSAAREEVRLDDVAEEIVDILKETADRRIRIELHVTDPVPPAQVNRSEMQQVVMNLLVNAVDALRQELDEGRVGVEPPAVTMSVQPEQSPAGRSMVRLSVRDTGPGIPPEIKEHIFEPFFTTKPRGQGTGLGLAMAKSIVEEYGGVIDVDSAPGLGTTFTLRLPAQPAQPAEDNEGNGHSAA